ncbi:hypothetical protein [Paenibacillus lemnae]|uniref:Nuclear transport factor 2 family protein n=1 Tax=Paenibacillus lemnae TaxID=1330551 RepID=A0A848MA62_PAELE|nr:hypothetical protein [Paenibacillus lemnae]NMO97050.1 hypothetical protein [Paenibacillus lemnae]
MKNYRMLSVLVLSVSLISACSSSNESVVTSKKIADSSPLSSSEISTKHVSDPPTFTEPSSAEWVEYSRAVREYFYYRSQAVLHDDMELLMNRYPDLREGEIADRGINMYKNLTHHPSSDQLIHVNFDIEDRNRIGVHHAENGEIILQVHGMIEYVHKDFETSGSELLINLYLKKEGDDWTVTKTDEYLDAEYKEWVTSQN